MACGALQLMEGFPVHSLIPARQPWREGGIVSFHGGQNEGSERLSNF